MALSVGDRLPDADLVTFSPDGPQTVALADKLAGRKVLLVGMPGAFTGTCSTAHLPGLIRSADALRAKGVDEIIVLTVNDVHVIQAWAEQTGGAEAGITFLGDPVSAFGKAIDFTFTAPDAGLIDRLQRFALVAEDGVVTLFRKEEKRGVCDLTSGDALVDLV